MSEHESQMQMHLKQLALGENELIAIAAHELKSPLATLRTLGYVGQDEYEITELQSLLQKVITVAEQGIASVDAILDLEQAKTGTKQLRVEPVHLPRVVHDIAQSMQPQLKERQQTIRVYDRTLPPVYSDERYVTRILHNLVDNAAKYSGEGKAIEVRFSMPGQNQIVKVRDYGVGISQHDWQTLFSKFGKAKRPLSSQSSSGLGLYISSQLADLLGGELALKRRRVGSCFELQLPVIEQLELWRAGAWR